MAAMLATEVCSTEGTQTEHLAAAATDLAGLEFVGRGGLALLMGDARRQRRHSM